MTKERSISRRRDCAIRRSLSFDTPKFTMEEHVKLFVKGILEGLNWIEFGSNSETIFYFGKIKGH
jgi:hypothetical protein